MIQQLDPPIPVDTPLGSGFALVLIDYGMNLNTCWIVALRHSRIIKHFTSEQLKLSANYTYDVKDI